MQLTVTEHVKGYSTIMTGQLDIQKMIAAVRDAARLCKRVQETEVFASEKTGKEPVTLADYGSQAILCRAVSQHYPDFGVIAEERGSHFLEGVPDDQRGIVATYVSDVLGIAVTEADIVTWLDFGRDVNARHKWVIDPIDGTKGFLGGRSYTIAAGMVEDGKPVAGILGSPGYDAGRLFYAVNGKAYVGSLDGGAFESIQVSGRSAGGEFTVAESFESKHAAHDLMARVYAAANIVEPTVKRVDGQDKYGMIACGDADLYLRVSPTKGYVEKVWDHAAGVAVIQAAGGVVTDMDGNALDFGAGEKLVNNTFVVVSNGVIHDEIIAALGRVYAEAE